jgi:tRNA (guanine37-N1)-methyltransferase
MRIDIITIFPELFASVFEFGMIQKARKSGLVELKCWDLRQFTTDKHRTVDDRPFGGGEGMVLKPEPLAAAIRRACADSPEPWVVYMTPQGKPLDQGGVRGLAGRRHLVLVCGRYEGIDQRVVDLFVHEEISIGDFVLSGGEIPAMVVVDAVTRLLPGVVGHPDSTRNESFETEHLDCPVYTRPEVFEDRRVPEVLLSGNHARIQRWREGQRRERTRQRRPDLLKRRKSTNEVNDNE